MMITLARIINFYWKLVLSPVEYWRRMGVSIGENCSIGRPVFSGEPFLICIGNHVQITDDVHFYTHGSGWIFRNEISDFDTFGKILIKDNVYIGSGASIMPGVTIESNVIIAAQSVVTKSVPEGVIVGGNPARIIGSVNNLKSRMLALNLKTKGFPYNKKRKVLENTPEEFFIKKDYLP